MFQGFPRQYTSRENKESACKIVWAQIGPYRQSIGQTIQKMLEETWATDIQWLFQPS